MVTSEAPLSLRSTCSDISGSCSQLRVKLKLEINEPTVVSLAKMQTLYLSCSDKKGAEFECKAFDVLVDVIFKP